MRDMMNMHRLTILMPLIITCTALIAGVLGDDNQKQDIECLATALMSEASVGTYEERVAVAWTIFNRVNSTKFPNSICGVVNQPYQYATNQKPTQELMDLAKTLISNPGSDPTTGAIYFFSPRSMPKEGDETFGYDVGGGLHDVTGIDKKVYFPSFTMTQEYVGVIRGVRPAYYMFYRDSVATTVQESENQSIAKAPSEEFNRTFGGNNDEIANFVQITSDGGYILAGMTKKQVGDEYGSAWLAKTDAQGNELWNKTLSPPTYNSQYIFTVGGSAKSVQPTSDGGYILTGWLDQPGIGRWPWILKTDDKGNVIWMKESNALSSIQLTSDGNYIVAGNTPLKRTPLDRPWLSKIDDKGDEIWNKTFDTFYMDFQMYPSGHSVAQSVQPTPDGGYIVAGMNYGFCNFNGCKRTETWLIKTDESGNEIWNKKFEADGINYDDNVVSVRLTSDGGYILILQGISNRLIKTDDKGDEIWNKKLYSIYGQDLKTTSDGGYILAGRSVSIFGAELVKIDAQGNKLWNETFGGEYTDEFTSVLATSDGSYVVAGRTNSFGAGGYDAWLVKTDAEGLVKTVPLETKSSNTQIMTTLGQNITKFQETSEPIQESPGLPGILAIAALISACFLRKSRW